MMNVPTSGQHPGDSHGHELADEQPLTAFDQAQRLAAAVSTGSATARVANTPVRMAPSVPPTPCTPKASSESS